MIPSMLQAHLARARERDIRAAVARPPLPRVTDRPRAPGRAREEAVSIRWAGPADIPGLERLARLDSTRLPRAPVLVAERDGQIVAGLPLSLETAAIADPFQRTAELVDLLELRAAQLARAERSGRGRPRPWRVLARRAVQG